MTTATFGKGSKSEHEAVYLETDDGHRYVLRRVGGNPFRDDAIRSLIGKRISCTGIVTDYVLLISRWTVVGDAGGGAPDRWPTS